MDTLSLDGVGRFQTVITASQSATTRKSTPSLTSYFYRKIEFLWTKATTEMQTLLSRFRSVSSHVKANQTDQVMQALLGLVARAVYAALIDADRLSAANYEDNIEYTKTNSNAPDWESLSVALDTHLLQLGSHTEQSIKNTTINQMRSYISDQCRQAAILEAGVLALHAPTGGGKTFAGLRWALARAKRKQRRRLFYVVSYTTILDQVYGEYLKAFDKCNVNSICCCIIAASSRTVPSNR